jgi:hypothetical protein
MLKNIVYSEAHARHGFPLEAQDSNVLLAA